MTRQSVLLCLLWMMTVASAVSPLIHNDIDDEMNGPPVRTLPPKSASVILREKRQAPSTTCRQCVIPEQDTAAFSVYRRAMFTANKTSRIPMDGVFYNSDNRYNMSTNRFKAPVDGIYAFYFGATSTYGKMMNLYLYAGNPEVPVALAFNDNSDLSDAGGQVILRLSKGDYVSMWSEGDDTGMYSIGFDGLPRPTTFFNGHLIYDFTIRPSIAEVTSDVVAFSLTRKSPFIRVKNTILPMENFFCNIGGHYGLSSHTFKAPVDGLYVFYVMGTNAIGKSMSLSFIENFWKKASFTYGRISDQKSRQAGNAGARIILKLNQGDDVNVELKGGTGLGSLYSAGTFFNGFLLHKFTNKTVNTDVIAFSAAMGNTFPIDFNNKARIPMNTIYYNDGGHYNKLTGIFTAPVTGLYSFYFGVTTADSHMLLYLYAGKPEMYVASTYDYVMNGVNMAGGQIILQLTKSDTASVWLKTEKMKNRWYATFFNGYLLQKLT